MMINPNCRFSHRNLRSCNFLILSHSRVRKISSRDSCVSVSEKLQFNTFLVGWSMNRLIGALWGEKDGSYRKLRLDGKQQRPQHGDCSQFDQNWTAFAHFLKKKKEQSHVKAFIYSWLARRTSSVAPHTNRKPRAPTNSLDMFECDKQRVRPVISKCFFHGHVK